MDSVDDAKYPTFARAARDKREGSFNDVQPRSRLRLSGGSRLCLTTPLRFAVALLAVGLMSTFGGGCRRSVVKRPAP